MRFVFKIFFVVAFLSGCDFYAKNSSDYKLCADSYVRGYLNSKYGGDPALAFDEVNIWRSKQDGGKYGKVFFRSREAGLGGVPVSVVIECRLADGDSLKKGGDAVFGMYRNGVLVGGLVFNDAEVDGYKNFAGLTSELDELFSRQGALRGSIAVAVNKTIDAVYRLEVRSK